MFESVSFIQLAATLTYLGLLASIVKHTDFGQLKKPKYQHILFGACAAVCLLWVFRTGIYDGLNVHFLWLSALTLTLGFRWAMLAGAVALSGTTLLGMDTLAMFGVNGLLAVSLPVALTYGIYSLSFHRLPRHVFVYIFVCAFFSGALALTTKMGLMGGYFMVEGFHDWDTIRDNYLILIPLLLLPEGMLNGMTMTLLVIYQPSWA